MKELFSKQQEKINYFFDKIDLLKAEELLDLLFNTKGMIFITGIGKSGTIAKKIANSMTSVSVKALYLSPVDALHGDIGILSKEDVFILISKSGETEELLNLIPFLRNKGVTLVALVCQKGSRLSKACDFEMVLPLKGELCKFGLMPTTSSAIQLIFGDLMATGLMERGDFDLEAYKRNHPAGQIGKRMTMMVRDLMLTGEKIPLCSPSDKLVDQLVELSNKQCGCLIVVDEKKRLLGIFTDGDLRRSLQKHGDKALLMKIEEVMTRSPRSIGPHELAVKAVEEMESNQKSPITVLPVLEEGAVVGLIKMHDLLQSGI